MILDKSEEEEINLLVAKYLEQINSKLTKKFSEAANLPPLSERDQTSEVSLETVVQYYIQTGGGKRKCSEGRSSGERNDKKQRLEEQTVRSVLGEVWAVAVVISGCRGGQGG